MAAVARFGLCGNQERGHECGRVVAAYAERFVPAPGIPLVPSQLGARIEAELIRESSGPCGECLSWVLPTGERRGRESRGGPQRPRRGRGRVDVPAAPADVRV